MRPSVGPESSPIWLIGDSPPKGCHDKLAHPLDGRHPARHNIWTPILDVIQGTVFHAGLRLDDSALYVRNAVDRVDVIDEKRVDWKSDRLMRCVDDLAGRIGAAKARPLLILSFGAFACEMVCRARRASTGFKHTDRSVGAWSTKALGQTFREAVCRFNAKDVNHLPLLHASIARRHFLTAHRHFCDGNAGGHPNYFEYVGKMLAELLVQHMRNASIWGPPRPEPGV